MKSKKYIVTSIATATLGLALLTDTAGMSPFSIQQVSAQEKSTPKNGNVKENNLPKQSEKPKSSAPKQSEKPKSSTPKQSDKQKNTTPKQDKPKSKVQSGWVGSSYYENGVKVTNKWIFDKKVNSYFYLNASGNYVQNAWVGNYYLKSDGKRAKNEWIFDKKANSYFYLNASGNAVRNTWVGNYYLKSDGKRVKSDWIYDKNSGSYYYLTAEGSIARNKWIGNYYLKSDGKMAKNEWVDGGRYYVESDGKMASNKWVDGGRYYVGYDGVWQPKPAAGNPYSAALKRAQGYNGIHLSKKRIYEMLIYEGFNSDTAQYAINHLQADYKANALAKARQYLKYGILSKTKIYDWLTSPSIDKFTKEEANYAIQHLDY